MNASISAFVGELPKISSQLEALYRQHIADQAELLPHVLMGEVTRLVVANAGEDGAPWLVELLRQLEDGLKSGDDQLAELIGVSFVENLLGEEPAINVLIPMMGPTLRQEVKVICGV